MSGVVTAKASTPPDLHSGYTTLLLTPSLATPSFVLLLGVPIPNPTFSILLTFKTN